MTTATMSSTSSHLRRVTQYPSRTSSSCVASPGNRCLRIQQRDGSTLVLVVADATHHCVVEARYGGNRQKTACADITWSTSGAYHFAAGSPACMVSDRIRKHGLKNHPPSPPPKAIRFPRCCAMAADCDVRFTAPTGNTVLVWSWARCWTGKRPVSACLRMTGARRAKNFSSYHQLLKPCPWKPPRHWRGTWWALVVKPPRAIPCVIVRRHHQRR